MPEVRKYDLEERFINFAIDVVLICRLLPKDYTTNHFVKQITRSGSAPALMYGEALGASSKKDFAYKLSLILKELRETLITIKILMRIEEQGNRNKLQYLLKECDELIRITASSLKTVRTQIKNKSISNIGYSIFIIP